MAIQTFLGGSISAIREQVRSLVSYRDTPDQSFWQSLTPDKRDAYIKQYEEFWFTFETLSGFVDELHFLFARLEQLRSLITDPPDHLGHRYDEALACRACWRLVFSDIYALVSFLVRSQVLPPTWKESYRELRYIYLLRNAFAQHPELSRPFDVFGLVQSVKHDQRFLPVVLFGPQGSGAYFYLTHYQSKCEPRQESHEVLQQDNKQMFIDNGGWTDSLNDDQQARLKGWGLPEIDQDKFSAELRNLFGMHVFPYLRTSVEAAKRENVIRTVRAQQPAASSAAQPPA